MNPTAYIVAGPNGAGKTTFARSFLPHYADCRNFINADLIASGVSPFAPDAAAFRAGRLMLQGIEMYAAKHTTFAFETTLAGRSYAGLIRRLHNGGYAVHIFFLAVPDVAVALSRVKERVLSGGHDIPETVLRRRFHRSTRNFLLSYHRLVDSWTLFDNSAEAPLILALKNVDGVRILEQERYSAMVTRYGAQ